MQQEKESITIDSLFSEFNKLKEEIEIVKKEIRAFEPFKLYIEKCKKIDGIKFQLKSMLAQKQDELDYETVEVRKTIKIPISKQIDNDFHQRLHDMILNNEKSEKLP